MMGDGGSPTLGRALPAWPLESPVRCRSRLRPGPPPRWYRRLEDRVQQSGGAPLAVFAASIVARRRGGVGVADEALHQRKVGSTIQQVRDERAAEVVRREIGDPSLLRPALEGPVQSLWAQTPCPVCRGDLPSGTSRAASRSVSTEWTALSWGSNDGS